jgi:hypothetical protein
MIHAGANPSAWRCSRLCNTAWLTNPAFADPQFPQPRVSVYEEHQHAWLRPPDDMEHLD